MTPLLSLRNLLMDVCFCTRAQAGKCSITKVGLARACPNKLSQPHGLCDCAYKEYVLVVSYGVFAG